MEPIKGGSLVNLPEDALEVLKDLNGGSPASYVLRFAAGFEGIRGVRLHQMRQRNLKSRAD